MKIGIINWSDGKIGGAESYLAAILPALVSRGEMIAFWSESAGPEERGSVVPDGVPVWRASELGLMASIDALREWGPDLLYVQGLTDPAIEARLQSVAPGVFFAHGYYGTCITGSKTLNRPEIRACHREFGWGCIARFYPDRCGGRSPLTMLTDFRVQGQRLKLLRNYEMVLCASEHMRQEYLRHGLPREAVRLAPYPIEGSGKTPVRQPIPVGEEPWKILFAGRMEPQKGVDLLIESLPLVAARLQRPIAVTFAGEGRQRPALERQAREVAGGNPLVTTRFAGWMDESTLAATTAESHLLALPSVWPEPFGMSGVEAGLLGVPTAAFAVGGIPGWLDHGVSGMLAPADPPTAGGFADAIAACLDPDRYEALSSGALLGARRFSLDAHLELLMAALDEAHRGARAALVSPIAG